LSPGKNHKRPPPGAVEAESGGSDIRRRAEAQFSRQDPVSNDLFGQDAGRVMQELQVHQLEMQNDELRRAQVELDSAKERYFNLYNLAPVGYVTIDENRRILEANLTAARMLDVERSALVKRPLARFIFSADQLIFRRCCRQLFPKTGFLETGAPQVFDLRMLRKDGTLFWARLTADSAPPKIGRVTLVDITDRKLKEDEVEQLNRVLEQSVLEHTLELSRTIDSLKEEITGHRAAELELKNSESRFQAIIEQAVEGFVLLDEEGRIIESNRAIEKITGLAQTEIRGQYVWDFQAKISGRTNFTPAKNEQVRNLFIEAMHNKDALMFNQLQEVQIITSRGEKKVIQQVTFPVNLNSTTHLGTFVRDITAQKQAEADLLKLNDELEKRVAQRTQQLENSNKELDSFSYSVSHDLRAPLRSIAGHANILLEDARDVLSAENLKSLERIQVNIGRMEALVSSLLAFSRLAQKPLERRPVNLSQLIRSAWDEVSVEAGERRIQITIEAPPDCTADGVLLKQVYVNLLSNALKYSRSRPEAVIEVGWRPQDGGYLFWVKDNGIGFDMQYADRLFGIFQRLHSADQFEGTGIGLTTVQRIIRRHGGRIWAEAYPDQGATFYFTLG